MSNEAQIDPNKSVTMMNANQEENKEGNNTRSQNKTRNEDPNNKSQIKTTKLPYIQTSTSYGTKRKGLNTSYSLTQPKCDVDGLIQELYYSKNKNYALSKEYRDLKIAYSKLLESNQINQRIIEAMLKIDPDEEVSEKDMKEKIDSSQPSKEEEKKLKEAHSVIILQKRLTAVNAALNEKEDELKKLKQNSKVIKLKEYEAALISQDKDIKRLKEENDKLYQRIAESNQKNEELKVKNDFYRAQSTQNKTKLKDAQADYENEQRKSEDLQKQKLKEFFR